MMARSCLGAAVAVTLSAGAAFAQSNEDGQGVGIGAGVARDLKASTDYRPQPLSYAVRDWQGSTADPSWVPAALRLRSELAPSVTFQAGPLLGRYEEGSLRDTTRAGAMNRGNSGTEFGGFAGLVMNDDVMPGTAVGLNLQGVTDGSRYGDGMMFELGADYTTTVAEFWQFSARLSSSFAAESALGPVLGDSGNGSAKAGLDDSRADAGFKGVGLGVGLDYNFAESWNLETSLGYSRFIGDAHRRSLADEDSNSHQFFGGVVVNYRF